MKKILLIALIISCSINSKQNVIEYRDIDKLKIEQSFSRKVLKKFNLHYIENKKMKRILESYDLDAKISSLENSNKLLIYLEENNINLIKKIIKEHDKKKLNYQIEIEIISLANATKKSYKSPLADTNKVIKLKENIFNPIKDLETMINTGQAKRILKKNIFIEEGKTSFSYLGEKIPFKKEILNEKYKAIDIQHIENENKIEIHVKKITQDKIIADVELKLSQIKLWLSINGTNYPHLQKNDFKIPITLKLNKKTVITNLSYSSKGNSSEDNLILVKIFPLNWLFKRTNEEEEDLSIYITAIAKALE